MVDELKPHSHAERVALHRAQVLGNLAQRDFLRGELKAELTRLSTLRFVAPGMAHSRSYGVSTLERWHYLFKNGGLEALKPARRSDAGYARLLTKAQKALLCDIRREFSSASAALILRTLETDGRLEKGRVSVSTVRRLFRENGLPRRPRHQVLEQRTRRRWQAERPGFIWHSDVCHGPTLRCDGRSTPVRIHALLDDASRYVVALMVVNNEREVVMLELMVRALRKFGAPRTLYLDNGATYRGETLATACARLGISLLHAKPYDPQARGKMERFWRTLREGCLDHIGQRASLHDIQVRLLAWLDVHYHRAPHAGLMGKSPEQVWASRELTQINEKMLSSALTTSARRKVRTDGTISVGGLDWEVEQGYLAGKGVRIERILLEPNTPPVLVHESQKFTLVPVDPALNAKRRRAPFKPKPGIDAIAFDPATVMLDQLFGKHS